MPAAVRRSPLLVLLVLLMFATALPSPASAASRTSGLFADDDSSPHEGAIEALAVSGITRGCDVGEYCPGDDVSRGQVAAFVNRIVKLPAPTRDYFTDDDRSVFQRDINRIREAGIVRGCNRPAYTRFCPTRSVSRAELAVILVNALNLPASKRDFFTDDEGPFEGAIQSLRAAKLIKGCNPPAYDEYCPGQKVTRAQLATMLRNAKGYRQLWPLDGSTCPARGYPCTASNRTHPVAFTWNGIRLRSPSSATELVGFHQSNHDGARTLTDTGAERTTTMESRNRGTGRRSAADIVAHPGVEIRSPVSGTVKRSGTYRLYCRYSDDFVVIEPTGRRGIEVKMLHIDGVRVRAGDKVVAGVTVVARGPTPLPFASQVDELSHPRDWPHVHLEVVDTSIPDRPSGGGC